MTMTTTATTDPITADPMLPRPYSVMQVIYEVLPNREKYGRLVILYGARSPRDLLYRKELAAWARQRETQVLVTVDNGGVRWGGRLGGGATGFQYARLQPAHSVAMVCGPEIM